MAQIDHSIYLQSQAPDILGGVERGMRMSDMIKDRKLKEQEIQRQAGLKKAYAAGVVQNPDGTTSYNPQLTMSALAQGGYGQEAQAIGDQLAQRDILAAKAAQENQWKAQEFKLREQELMSRAADRKEARDERRFQAGIVRDEKMQGLKTPYGLANTVDDAKQLKEAHEAKFNFDSKIQEMIDLRKKYGTEYLNREAVARGKQLSKDLLLEYKNMAKLGVLSKADEDIINAIIPADPLGQDWAPGQDPILSNLTKFKADSDRDFATRVQTRTREGISQSQTAGPRHGTVEDGYVFLGGDPANPKNWMKR